MAVVEPRGHQAVLAGLFAAARAGRLAHALLFQGQAGIGKFLSARWLAAGLLCERGPAPPCAACGACRRFAAGSHADLFVLDPRELGEEWIRVDRIRAGPEDGAPSVGDFLALRAREGGWRVVLIREADRLNGAAQNALLKMLEEPGEGVLFVLETARGDRLLETTRSRCVRIGFAPLALPDVAALLEERGTRLPAELLRWARGSPGRALELASCSAVRQRQLALEVVAGGCSVAAALEELFELEFDSSDESPAAQARARARLFLDFLLEVLLDGERAAAGLPLAGLAHGDLAPQLAGPAAVRERRLEQALAARQDVERNLAGEAAVERALLALRGAVPAPVHAR